MVCFLDACQVSLDSNSDSEDMLPKLPLKKKPAAPVKKVAKAKPAAKPKPAPKGKEKVLRY